MRTSKYILFWFAMMTLLFACTGKNGSREGGSENSGSSFSGGDRPPEITFGKLTHDFGTIIDGEKVLCHFEYENSGGSELVLQSVHATCGCTTPDWSREPLVPGEKGSMTIIFDATGRSGAQRKVITVDSNAENSPVKLTLTALVETKM